MRTLLESDEIDHGLRQMATDIAAPPRGTEGLLLIAIRRGGLAVVAKLAQFIEESNGLRVPVGSVDITLYRDDAATALPNPRIGPCEIPASLDGTRVVLVDDVLFTRRTIRAAIDAIMDYGRPENIELAVVVDRSGRQLPIQPDYSILRVEDVQDDERVDVFDDDGSLTAIIQPKSAPSVAPPAL